MTHKKKLGNIVQESADADDQNSAEDFDPWTAWAYRPRTISFLLIGAFLLM